jgi:FtsP/CotA-like multicopper oxidase with cupredoxin domain
VTSDRKRLLVACLATVAILAPLVYFWQASLVPSTYAVVNMGYMDYGGGPRGSTMPSHKSSSVGNDVHTPGGTVSVAQLVADPRRKADVTVDLVARQQTFTLASGRKVDGYTINGQSPGPMIKVTEGQLLEVHLRNASVPDGITLHWHGVDVPNAEDGVAGVTQDAVRPGREYTYRFVASDPGTYWYHSHQLSHDQVVGGLLGPLVVLPRHPDPSVIDVVGLEHTYDGFQTLNGREGAVPVVAKPGQTVRVRAINTDNGPLGVWASAPYTLVAVDGRDLHGPTPVQGRQVVVGAGGRADVEVTAPSDGSAVRVQLGAASAFLVGPKGATVRPVPQPQADLDLLHYGTPAPLGFDPSKPDRTFGLSIGRRPGFVDGRPGLWWSVNGHLFPDVPMFVVREGDVVRMHIENHSGDVHPMHLHGHHAVVLSRDGKPATGSPWWVDSLNAESGESYDIAFVADNPGIWMDHCHNLQHAAQGLVMHLMYAGVTEPYRVGGSSDNEPE